MQGYKLIDVQSIEGQKSKSGFTKRWLIVEFDGQRLAIGPNVVKAKTEARPASAPAPADLEALVAAAVKAALAAK